MIWTGSHKACKSDIYRLVAISGNRGKDANFDGECYSKLAPKLSFWEIWHEQIGLVSEIDNNRYYIKEYYEQVLSKLDPFEVAFYLDDSILLCYEDNNLFCHRHIVAAWLEITLNIEVPEVEMENEKLIYLVRPAYIKEELQKVMSNEVVHKRVK